MNRVTVVGLVAMGPTVAFTFMMLRALRNHRLWEAVLWSTGLAAYAIAMVALTTAVHVRSFP